MKMRIEQVRSIQDAMEFTEQYPGITIRPVNGNSSYGLVYSLWNNRYETIKNGLIIGATRRFAEGVVDEPWEIVYPWSWGRYRPSKIFRDSYHIGYKIKLRRSA